MESNTVPPALRERLGPEATAGLLELLARARGVWKHEVVDVITDRFERRLVEETSKLRVEMMQGFAALRHEIAELRQEVRTGIGGLRQELSADIGGLRQELSAAIVGLRQELSVDIVGLRQEVRADVAGLRQTMAQDRFELLKWAFLFWVGQFFAMASLVAVLVRFLRAGG